MKVFSWVSNYIEKNFEKELAEYREYYKKVCDGRDSFCRAVNNGACGGLENAAFNFLCQIKRFKMNVPRGVIRRAIRKGKYENFEKAEDFARVIAGRYLTKIKS